MSSVAEVRRPYNAVNREVASDPAVLSRVAEAIELIEEGTPLKDALVACGLKRTMFSAALSSERELASRYARARVTSSHFLVDEAIEVVKTEENQIKARNIADMYRWAAGKFNSRDYGEKIDLNVSGQLDISSTLLEAKTRMLRPVRDQQMIEDAQVIDSQGLIVHTSPDSQSEPDIFGSSSETQTAAPGSDEIDIFS